MNCKILCVNHLELTFNFGNSMLKNNALKKIAFGFLLSTTLGHASNYGDEESNQYYPSSRIREEEYRPRQKEEKYPKFSVESMESF